MLEYISRKANMTRTENGAAAYASTNSRCLDFFATIGGLRRESDVEIITRFVRAYTENPDAAMKLLFFARDVRGGLGERRIFRVILGYLAEYSPFSVLKNLEYIAEYGRFDDLLSLLDTPCESIMLSFIKDRFIADTEALKNGGSVSLLAKWLPSVNATSAVAAANGKKIARTLGISQADYRRTLSALRAKIRIIENNLRERNYTFDYEKQPSRALFKYKKAFRRNDGERYKAFLSAAASGKAVLHADNVAPYELVDPYIIDRGCIKPEDEAAINATWASLPDYGSDENALAVIDTSGSMYCFPQPTPAAVALSLGLYFAEHNKGAFANCFIEFSERPQLIRLEGDTFAERLRYAMTFEEVADTNLEAVFDLILDAAAENNVPQSELPAKLVIISDMEFNCCVEKADDTVFENARRKFEARGYRLPQVVFWNVASRNRQQPVTQNEQGVALVSGATPRIFSMIAGGVLSPLAFMREVLESERYSEISA